MNRWSYSGQRVEPGPRRSVTGSRRVGGGRGTQPLAWLAILMLLCACGSSPGSDGPVDLSVYAAASLTEAFGEIGKGFEADNKGTRVTFQFAGSQQLAQQLAQGAPADVVASANERQLNAVVEANRIEESVARPFASNKLVIVYPEANPAGIRSLGDLARPGVKVILAAKEVPVGQYSLDFLDAASRDPQLGAEYKSEVLGNVVSYEENVRAVLAKVALGEADAGIVYSSDATGDAAEKTARLEIPAELNQAASYPIAVIQNARQPELARRFVEYVLSPAGQVVLERHGFVRVDADEG